MFQRREVTPGHDAGLGMSQEQYPFRMQQTLQYLQGLGLGRAVEVDQQIAAEHHIVERAVDAEARGKQIGVLEM